jgi:signal transduction histidine kinase
MADAQVLQRKNLTRDAATSTFGETAAGWKDSTMSTTSEDPDGRAHSLLRIACHDLCTPLSAIQMHVQSVLLKARRGDELQVDRLIDVFVRLERLAGDGARLVDDVLAVGRLETRTPEPEIETDLEEVLAATILMHAEALRRAACDIFVEKENAADRIRGHWNRRILMSILSNLLQNVCRYASGAPVRICLSRCDSRARILIADGGPGLPGQSPLSGEKTPPPEALKESHGLGIWIIHRSVAELGGKIEMRNGNSGGLVCDIWLPT